MQYQRVLRQRAAFFCVTASVSIVSAFAGSESYNLPNFYKVDDHVYRGGQPTDDGFKDLAKLGIKTVIDLREIGEHSQAQEETMVTGLEMRYLSVPMKGMSTPNDKQVADVLALLNDSSSGPVFVHCKRGADRTGMVIAIYRMSHDHWANKAALSEAKSDGMSFFERAIQRYVMDYKPSAVTATAPFTTQVHGAAQ
jgi:tyrosine-protein phosphatase SIW14